MSVIIVNTLSGYTNGTINIPDYTAELTALNTTLTTQLTAINTNLTKFNSYLDLFVGPAGLETPGSPIAVWAAQAGSLDNIQRISASLMKTQSEIAANLNKVTTGIGNLSAHAATNNVTQQVLLTETIKNNQFQQVTTNAALERSGLPATTVPSQTLQTQITQTVSDVSKVSAAVQSAALVQNGITSAAGYTVGVVTDYVAQSFIGTAAASAWTQVKGWWATIKPEEVLKEAESEASSIRSKVVTGGK